MGWSRKTLARFSHRWLWLRHWRCRLTLTPSTASAMTVQSFSTSKDANSRVQALTDATVNVLAKYLPRLRSETDPNGTPKSSDRLAVERQRADMIENIVIIIDPNKMAALIFTTENTNPNESLEGVVYSYIKDELVAEEAQMAAQHAPAPDQTPGKDP